MYKNREYKCKYKNHQKLGYTNASNEYARAMKYKHIIIKCGSLDVRV